MATSRQLQQFLDSLEPRLRQAFLEDVAASKYRANIGDLEKAVTTGDIEAVLYAAGIRSGQWSNLVEALRVTYREGGAFAVSTDVPARFGMRFDISNPRAQSWLSQHSSSLIVDINSSQRKAVQQTISAGFGQGRGPRDIALDIAGRVSAQTGRRTGGIIGLHEPFSNAASKAREELGLLSNNYFSRTRRDQRFDATVRKAIASGKPLSQPEINKIVGRYEDRLLESRATNIARTEALSSMNASGGEAMSQVVDDGLASNDAIDETWDAAADSRTRPDHFAADGQTIIHGESFSVGGYQMRFPGDTSMGAGADQIVNCRCVVRREIDFSKTVL